MRRKRTWTNSVRPIVVDGDIARITLTKGAVAIIDAADVPLVEGWNWTLTPDGYAMRGDTVQGRLVLHRVILQPAHGFIADHRNGNRLDCRRENLRQATWQQNTFNRGLSATNRSGFKGVGWRKDRDRWQARITVNGKPIRLGLHLTAEEAARARDAASLRYHGEFAVLNFPLEEAGA